VTRLIIIFALVSSVSAEPIDFSKQIRPILSENCFFCHGPDEKKREAGLRLDDETSTKKSNDGVIAVVPGNIEKSALIERILSSDPDEIMPPPKQHKTISSAQVALLKDWIKQGAKWGKHWSYEKVVKPAVPVGAVNPVDAFIVQRLTREGLKFSPQADAATLIRRVALDLTGLPPTLEELDSLSKQPHDKIVDHFLNKPAYGEHWARQWLDLARYADSSGYPSDQPREIWAYRDWVIRALNSNMSFDQFTIEQNAGDLLPNPTDDQLIATAFHRNTMTQNEGGTDDEEFRNAAIIDRVNTTFAVFMGTTMACAQCHTHKYDPLTINEYFQFYAFLNQSADSDKKDEAPFHSFDTPEQKQQSDSWNAELAKLNTKLANPDAKWLAGLDAWEKSLPLQAAWTPLKPVVARSSSGTKMEVRDDSRVIAAKPAKATDSYHVELPVTAGSLEAVRIEALADAALPGGGPGHAGGNFVLSQIKAELVPDDAKPAKARHLKIELVSKKYDFLALAEVQVFSGDQNIALKGKATQISTTPNGPEAKLAIDGNTNGESDKGKSVAVSGGGTEHQWWQLDLGSVQSVDRIVIWKRTDKGQGSYIEDLKLTLLDEQMKPVWEQEVKKKFEPREEVSVSGRRELLFTNAFADATQDTFDPKQVITDKPAKDKGWALAGHIGKDHALTLLPARSEKIATPSRLILTLNQTSQWAEHTLGAFRVSVSNDARIAKLAPLPANVLSALSTPAAGRKPAETTTIRDYFVRQIAPETKTERECITALNKQLAALKMVTVPVMRDLDPKQRRVTKVQLRGNWQALGDEVNEATPAIFNPLPTNAPKNRLTMAKWLVSRDNPLTARVTVNRLWESIFGTGIVRSSEEFGSQGDLPFHPELLDWLAAELMDSGWDIKHMLKLMLTSQAYQQSSKSTPELNERDPDNRLLARGPRFRPTGELLRDQSLAVSGLLSAKMYGLPVRPATPNMGLSTAFGRSNDWTVSEGDDKHRRSLYTEVRRNSPYASFTTFDAGNREVCMIRRSRTNTPLQAFVTLNDPVFIETNQAMARRLFAEAKSTPERLTHLFKLCLSRDPTPHEAESLTKLHAETLTAYQADLPAATKMATDPLGPADKSANLPELAAWTTIANVVMNLDEFLMRR